MITINALLQRGLKKIWASKSGGVLIYVAFGLPILLGAMALSIDLGRALILNTELKDFSDASALAGAAELDGRDGARDGARDAAEAAARTGITGTLLNLQGFATDGGGPNIVVDPGPGGVVFLKKLPADGTDFVADDTATSDADARFIFVKVVNRDVRSGLSRSLGVIAPFETSAKSIAGFVRVTCKVPTMFMCNPLEDPTFTPPSSPLGLNPTAFPSGGCQLGTAVPVVGQEGCLRGIQMLLKRNGGNSGSYFPGEFGLLQCPPSMGGPGADCVKESIATAEPSHCISAFAKVKTGQNTGPVSAAINVRFDYFSPLMGGNVGGGGPPGTTPEVQDPNYRPAIHVQKGWQPRAGGGQKGCSEPGEFPEVTTMALPRDSCFYLDPVCPGGNGRYGVGDWHGKGDEYWAINHVGVARADSIYSRSYPAAAKKLVHSWRVNCSMPSAITSHSSVIVLAAALRSRALSLENAISIGLKSGE